MAEVIPTESTSTDTGVFLSSVKVFIAGIQVYPLAVTIRAAFNETPTASISIGADPRLFELGRYDRVPVQVFVLESVAESNQYILMFEGFITARSYSNTISQRRMTFSCAAFTEVFKDTRLNFISSLAQAASASVTGNDTIAMSVFKPAMHFPECLFYEGLGCATPNSKDFTPQNMIKMPTQYLANLMAFIEEAGLTHSVAGRYNDSIVAKYYAILSHNLHLDRRFCWLPYFDIGVDESKLDIKDSSGSYDWAWKAEDISESDATSGTKSVMFPVLYGVRADLVMQLLTNGINSSAHEYSIYELLYFLIDRMEYDFLVIPTPAYQENDGDDEGASIDSKVPSKLSDSDLKNDQGIDAPSPVEESAVQEMANVFDKRYGPDRKCTRMVNFCVKPVLDDTFPPLCNVIFRSQVVSLRTSTNFNGSPTRVQVTGFIPTNAQGKQMGINQDPLALYGSIDFYPCPEGMFGKQIDQNPNKRALMSSELLEIEKYTGPHVARAQAPAWLFYSTQHIATTTPATDNQDKKDKSSESESTTVVANDSSDMEQVKKMREQFMRRQLTRARILNRQLSAECIFLPYITCGFPGVVFDSATTGFAFTGNVIAYEHHFTPTDMSTSVMMNGVRLLTEAASDEKYGNYPNPINSVHAITHTKERMSLVYNCILGTPNSNSISGANAASWDDIITSWYGEVDDVESSPQANVYIAYRVQRRNIITLPDYAKFMGMDYNGTDLDSEWLRDRSKLKAFNAIPLKQEILPVDEIEKDKKDGSPSTKGSSANGKYSNYSDRDVRELLTEVRNETAKHYIY